ncbi:putative ubiquitinyl hydrolase 1 [Medicago truncatula]|uniref:AMSH-like ubiquitin thioesterase n=1 Tax=Medicago truncatula TaxID=3880 RepID=G7KN01_MEDTR|nr:AMSH-like ubiquitin thioesterase 1 isoform X2 [Medicago truncatula]AES76660.1 AMSH-like ubiquitin thioesterase [Medicago truncatula]RHN52782.1 putative ubiquitinyl hydrolase 1 [Medicago truncatula]
MRSSSSTSGEINIAMSAQKLDVDNRISLRFYYRIADNILRQADIFRAERNIIDLYVMLLRFSSLVSETIPRHREYRSSPSTKKQSLKKRLLISLNELEKLKPLVQQKINELNSRNAHQQNGRGNFHSNNSVDFSSAKKQTLPGNGQIKAVRETAKEFVYQGSSGQQFTYVRPVEEQVRRLSLTLPPPKQETLSRHSIFGPNGLNGQWRPPTTGTGIRYPTNIDLSPVELPSLQRPLEDASSSNKDNSIEELHKLDLNSIPTDSEDSQPQRAQESPSLISFEETDTSAQVELIRQPSPPPVLAEVHDLVPAVSPHVNEAGCKTEIPSSDSCVRAESPLQLHISTALMENFMKLAKSNTKKNLETCGVLAGLLKNRKFYITALIIPKQESTSDSCQTTHEEEIFEVQDKRSLFPLGWIHTHPTQSCFMSSIDLHTHYSYQIMLPESVAIVMAPTDRSRNHGIFRLTTPGGMSVIKQCDQRGFHPHNQPPDGGPIYNTCTDVYMNPDLKFEVIDLR